MTDPGNEAGDCPRCGTTMTMVGYETSTVATYCEHCDLLVGLVGDTMTLSEALAEYDTDEHDQEAAYERHEPDAWGPDPMP